MKRSSRNLLILFLVLDFALAVAILASRGCPTLPVHAAPKETR